MKTTVFLLLFSAQVVAQHHTRLEPATIEVHYRHTMQHDTVRRLATTDFRGRHWTAWFATDIPVSDGPWKLGGLPGLILEAYDKGHQYTFTAVGLERVVEEPIIFTRRGGKNGYRTVGRHAFLKAKMFDLTHGGALGASGLKSTDYEPVYMDLIERDYR